MTTTQRSLQLRSDIQKVINAIDNQIDTYIASFTTNNEVKREVLKTVYLKRKKETENISTYMYNKYKK